MSESPADVESMRARIAELEAQSAAGDTQPQRTRRDRQWWRSVLATVLIVVATVLAPMAVVATWAHDQIGNTDQFMQTVTPLGSDPAVQNAIAERVTTEINKYVDVQDLTSEALGALAGQQFVPPRAAAVLPSLSAPLTRAIQNFVSERVDRFVHSTAFQEAWVSAVREAHTQMVAVLTGKTTGSGAIDVSDKGTVSVNVATFVSAAKQSLIDSGFSFASRIPDVNASFTIFQAKNLGAAQKGFGWLSTLARVLPVLALVLLFAGVMVARNRRLALMLAGLAVAGSMVLLGLTLNTVRPIYLDAIPPDVLPTDAAATIYDTVVQYIRTSLRAVGIVFLAIGLAAFWFAPTGAGAAVRAGASRGLARVRGRATGVGMNTGAVGDFLGRYRTFTRVTVVSLGALAYLAIDHPTGKSAVIVIVVVVLVLVVAEFVAAPTPPAEEPTAVTP